jgi:hypothetical protein
MSTLSSNHKRGKPFNINKIKKGLVTILPVSSVSLLQLKELKKSSTEQEKVIK